MDVRKKMFIPIEKKIFTILKFIYLSYFSIIKKIKNTLGSKVGELQITYSRKNFVHTLNGFTVPRWAIYYVNSYTTFNCYIVLINYD